MDKNGVECRSTALVLVGSRRSHCLFPDNSRSRSRSRSRQCCLSFAQCLSRLPSRERRSRYRYRYVIEEGLEVWSSSRDLPFVFPVGSDV